MWEEGRKGSGDWWQLIKESVPMITETVWFHWNIFIVIVIDYWLSSMKSDLVNFIKNYIFSSSIKNFGHHSRDQQVHKNFYWTSQFLVDFPVKWRTPNKSWNTRKGRRWTLEPNNIQGKHEIWVIKWKYVFSVER